MNEKEIKILSLKISIFVTISMTCVSLIMIFFPDATMSILTSIFGNSPDPEQAIKNLRYMGIFGSVVFVIGAVVNISNYIVMEERVKI
jgi:hypothetical protein